MLVPGWSRTARPSPQPGTTAPALQSPAAPFGGTAGGGAALQQPPAGDGGAAGAGSEEEKDLDGCLEDYDVPEDEATHDVELPPASGGVEEPDEGGQTRS